LDLIIEPKKRIDWLDVGTGNGVFAINYARFIAFYLLPTTPINLWLNDIKIDREDIRVKMEVTDSVNLNVHFPVESSADKIPFAKGAFNFITARHLLHWMNFDSQQRALEEIQRVSAENSIILLDVATPFNAVVAFETYHSRLNHGLGIEVDHPRYEQMYFPKTEHLNKMLQRLFPNHTVTAYPYIGDFPNNLGITNPQKPHRYTNGVEENVVFIAGPRK